jgi:hypothetical protein
MRRSTGSMGAAMSLWCSRLLTINSLMTLATSTNSRSLLRLAVLNRIAEPNDLLHVLSGKFAGARLLVLLSRSSAITNQWGPPISGTYYPSGLDVACCTRRESLVVHTVLRTS